MKGAFYGDLQGAVDSVYQGDVLIAAGDWNATSGAADVAIRHILGRSDLDRKCANADRIPHQRAAL